MAQVSLGSLQKRSFFQRSDFAADFSQKMENLSGWEWLADRFDKFNSNDARKATARIPRIIHQIWIGRRLPSSYQPWTDSWRLLNNGWDYRLWDSKAILNLGLRNERFFLESPSFGVKSDIARYEILERFGGVYADTDFECIRPIEEIASRCTFFAGLMFGSSPVISNGLLGAQPGHPLLRNAVDGITAPVRTKDGMDILNLTGPGYLSNLYFEKKAFLSDFDIIFPSSYFFPIPNFIKKDSMSLREKRSMAREWTFAIHYWETSWLRPPWWKKALSRCKKLLLSLLQWRRADAG